MFIYSALNVDSGTISNTQWGWCGERARQKCGSMLNTTHRNTVNSRFVKRKKYAHDCQLPVNTTYEKKGETRYRTTCKGHTPRRVQLCYVAPTYLPNYASSGV